MFKYTLILFTFINICFVGSGYGRSMAELPLPRDSQVVTGKLPNGITYYLRHNEEPEGRAAFSLIRNAGSLLENDAQNGLAHFLEHMAFQGTLHFPGKGIEQALGRYGLSAGREINAFTTPNETVYSISDVPVREAGVLDTCLLILHDWTAYLTLSDAEIDAERGVIAEEWRDRNTPAARARKKLLSVLCEGTPYAEHDVIGSLDVIHNFPYHEIRDFYREWYRTDLEAIAVVGDIDVSAMERKIVSLFSEVPAVENPKPRPFIEIPSHEELKYCLATDGGIGESSCQLITVLPSVDPAEDLRSYLRNDLIAGLFDQMTTSRVSELVRGGYSPFLKGYIRYGHLVRGYDSYTVFAGCSPGGEDRALEAILTENERILRYGFTPGELERAKKVLLQKVESECHGKRDNGQYMAEIQRHFLEGEPLLDAGRYYDTVRALLDSLAVEDIQAQVRRWNTAANRTLVLIGKSGIIYPDREDCLSVMDRVAAASLSPYEERVVLDAPLLSDSLPGSKIVSVKALPSFSAEEWTLGNGAKVVFRQADYEEDLVNLIAYSPGGTSLYDLNIYPSARAVPMFVNGYGAGDFNATDLEKMLAGKKVSCTAGLNEFGESLQGSCLPRDLETLFQLLYLRFEHPRFDEKAHEVLMEQRRAQVSTRTTGVIMGDSLQLLLSNHHPRTMLLDNAFFDRVSLQQIEWVYYDRFRDAGDFTFFITGNVAAEKLKPLVEKYIGSLPGGNRKEKWRDNGIRFPKGRTEKEIKLNISEPKSTVYLQYHREMPGTPYNRICTNVLQRILMSRLFESIREKEGGTYTPTVQMQAAYMPYSRFDLIVSFVCDPEKARYLESLVYGEAERLSKEPPSAEELDKAVEGIRKDREKARPHNSYWADCLLNYYIYGIDTNATKNFEDILARLRPGGFRKFAGKFFGKADVLDVVFEPAWW